jgi:hypothetical protein
MPKNIFYDPGPRQHGCSKSASSDTPIPGSPLVFCLEEVSCSYNEEERKWVLKVKSLIKKTKGSAYQKDDGSISYKDKITLTDTYTLDVTHLIDEEGIDEPIDTHSHDI